MKNQNLQKFKNNNKTYWFTNKNDIFYFTNFISTNMDVIFVDKEVFVLTDSRYLEQAKKKLININVVEKNKENILMIFNKSVDNKIFVDGNDLTVNQFNYYKNIFKDFELIPSDFSKVRTIKSIEEIEYIKTAIKLTEEILTKVTKLIKKGITEKQISEFIKIEALKIPGVEKLAFETIVAFKESGSNPHWSSSNKKIDSSGLLTIDLGINYKGYNSDITRTFFIIKNDKELSLEEKEIFDYCEKALDESIKLIKDNVSIKELDLKAREILNEKNLEKYFIHSLGHGLGIEVHEHPNLSKYSNEKLVEGMIVTVEPGVYIPGKYGVRIEEDVLVEADGYKILTSFKRKNTIYI